LNDRNKQGAYIYIKQGSGERVRKGGGKEREMDREEETGRYPCHVMYISMILYSLKDV
jgi:hypothetical protein